MISKHCKFMNEDRSTGSLLDKKAALKMLRDMQDSIDKITYSFQCHFKHSD